MINVNDIFEFVNFLRVQSLRSMKEDMYIYLACDEDDNVGVEYYIKSPAGYVLSDSKIFKMDYITSNKSLQNIILASDVAVDSILMHYLNREVVEFSINAKQPQFNAKELGTYQYRKDLGKIILNFDKESYLALPEEAKSKIKSNYLFSRKTGGWVSRAKFPNTYHAEKVAQELGLRKIESEGDIKSFEDQMSAKATRAEKRAERYTTYAENAEQRGKDLQAPFKEAVKDISFVTQPNIVDTASGRAFTRYREKLYKAYEKGINEFRKSDYYKDKAATALVTADDTKPTDKAFIQRRLNDAEKEIKQWKKPLDRYYSYRERMESGETITLSNHTILTAEKLNEAIDRAEEGVERAISKWVYYDKCMSDVGGVSYSKENIHKGDVVELKEWGNCLVLSTGPKNIKYKILDGGAKGFGGSTSYASIIRLVSKATQIETSHPFKVGEEYEIQQWGGDRYVTKTVKVVKATSKSVTLQIDDSKPFVRRPSKREGYRDNKAVWVVTVGDGYNEYFTKEEE